MSVLCAAVVAPRAQPPAMPAPTMAPSTVGISLYNTTGVTAAIRKHTNPVIRVPTAAAPSLTTDPEAGSPAGWARSFTATTRVITIASLDTTSATVRCTSLRADPRNSGSTFTDHTIGANAAAT